MEYNIRKSDLEKDRDKIIAFWVKQFPGWPEEKFNWFYADNPRGAADVWLAEHEKENEAVGAIACFPRRYAIEGREYLAGLGGDLGVSKDHRRKGLAMSLRKEMMANMTRANYAFLVGTPNDRSAKITFRAGYKQLGKIRRMTRILKSKAFIKKIARADFLAGALAGPVDSILRMTAKEKKYSDDDIYRGEIVESFDDRFDDLWKRSYGNYKLIGERTSDYLNWRFKQCPFAEFRTFILTDSSGEKLKGYITYWIHESAIEIADFYTEKMPEGLDPLIGKFLLRMREEPVDRVILTHFGNPAIRDKFEEFGYKYRPDQRTIILYGDEKSAWYELSHDENNWHFTTADNDVQ